METDTVIIEQLCNRFRLAQEATGVSMKKFAESVGMSAQSFSNLARYRNPPDHTAIWRAIREYGFTADWFYTGSKVGFRDPALLERLTAAESRLSGRGASDA